MPRRLLVGRQRWWVGGKAGDGEAEGRTELFFEVDDAVFAQLVGHLLCGPVARLSRHSVDCHCAYG